MKDILKEEINKIGIQLDDEQMNQFLKYYDFSKYFLDTECFGRTKKDKGSNIALLALRNQLDDAVYVGDIQGDYDSSKKAGVKFIHAAYGFGTVTARVPELEAFCELPRVLAEIL